MRNDSCFVPILIQEMRKNTSKLNPAECFDMYSKSFEDQSNYGLGIGKNESNFNTDGNKITEFQA